MRPTGDRYTLFDLQHLGRPDSVAACLLQTSQGGYIVDPGPSSTLPRLTRCLETRGHRIAEVRGLLLTHIHLDHAGASGTLARSNPDLRVYVHEKGARHLIDPGKLIGSAQRLYGDRMHELWGEIAPIPEPQVVIVQGGETLTLGELELQVAYTPGHAIHHVCYFEPQGHTVFVGDTAGIRGPRLPVVLPVTPPPDFNLDDWLSSIDRILQWSPRELVLTHFGVSPDPRPHLESLRDGLVTWTGYVRETLQVAAPDQDRVRLFVDKLRTWIGTRAPASLVNDYLGGAGPEACWQGIARYLTRQ
jgi:glyoxylase-like metal-dependent hydrolase (beta-lactamase superfamily II)